MSLLTYSHCRLGRVELVEIYDRQCGSLSFAAISPGTHEQ